MNPVENAQTWLPLNSGTGVNQPDRAEPPVPCRPGRATVPDPATGRPTRHTPPSYRRQTDDGRTDGRTNERTDERTDGRTPFFHTVDSDISFYLWFDVREISSNDKTKAIQSSRVKHRLSTR